MMKDEMAATEPANGGLSSFTVGNRVKFMSKPKGWNFWKGKILSGGGGRGDEGRLVVNSEFLG